MTSKEKYLKTLMPARKYRILFHLLFWIFYVGTITLFFGEISDIKNVFTRTVITASFNAVLVYFNLYYLLPVYFEKRKYWHYAVYLNLSVLIISIIRIEADFLLVKMFNFDGFVVHLFSALTHYLSILISCYLLLLLTSSIRFIKEYFENIQLREKIRYQKLEAELRNLKNQLNPHFLFNVLNNIYSLAYLKSDKAAPVILKLSEMMRYVLYECGEPKVPLKNEIEYLKNYLDLYQLKKEEKMNIEFKVNGNPDGVLIEPLLFLPLFENCFKHGNLEDTKNGWLKSELTINGKYLNLWIENSMGHPDQAKNLPGGIGVKNIKERLKMIYGNNCEFVEVEKNNSYSVSVMIVTK